jgi:hypothetical protein
MIFNVKAFIMPFLNKMVILAIIYINAIIMPA